MWQSPLRRRERGLHFREPDRAAWEILLTHRQAQFYLTAPSSWKTVFEKQCSVVWPRATVKEAPDPLAPLRPEAFGRMELRQHFMFSLRVDRRTQGILPSLLEVTRLLGEGERALVQVLLDPAPPDWWEGAASAYEEFRSGRFPKRLDVSTKAAAMAGLRLVAGIGVDAASIVSELISGETPPAIDVDGADRARALRERPIGATVAEKLKADALDVTIRVAVEADTRQAEALIRSIWYAFRALDGDNSFALVQEKPKAWARMQRREPGLKLNRDFLSIREASAIVQLPAGALQEQHGIEAVDRRETRLPKTVTGGGLQIGTHRYHGSETVVYLPTSNHDELCLPHVVIGGMGTGKTKGFGANLAVEAVKVGLGAVVIDPAKGEIGDEIEAALPNDKVVRIRFGQRPIALDWREALHSERARNRLANELIAFVDAASDEVGAQTVRFLRAAAKAVERGRLSEVIQLMTDGEYRAEQLPRMRPQEQAIWQAFATLTPARQAQIALPVLNRLDVIMGDDYLASCMDAEEGLDLVDLLEKPRAVILDIPKSELGTEGVDVLASLVTTKLDLAMVLRKSQHPVFIIQDEPHQYQRSARSWRAAAVESRKWRFGYVWMFHAWEQIPRDVAAIIQAAGPHYHLYTSSKATYRALAEEIAPFAVEEAMQTPRHWAINVMRAGGVTVPPFLAKMSPPPSLSRPEGEPDL